MATVDPRLAVEFCGSTMKNPIVAASGTFGFGLEYDGYLDLNTEVGAIFCKGIDTHSETR